jgi:galactokinase
LVPVDKVGDVKAALQREYYSRMDLSEEQKAQAMVVSRPAGGSALYMVSDEGVY